MLNQFAPKVEMKLGTGIFTMRVAADDVARERGLSGVESLKPNEGLLMAFNSDDTWTIWMKDMNIPIDIIWLDSDKKVVHIVKNVSPDGGEETVYEPKQAARYVVELPAGTVDNYVIKVNQVAEFTFSGDVR